jgi:pre-rRNA-processing protein TSR2
MTSRAAANKAAFAEGVGLVLGTWPLLALAVENEWGGPDSAAKAAWLGDVIVEVFDTSALLGHGGRGESGSTARGVCGAEPRTEQFELEDILLDILNAEFSTIAEDDSVPQVAAAVLRLYRECTHGNLAGVELLRARHATAAAATRAALQQSAADGDSGSSSTDDDDDDDDGEEEADQAAGAAGTEGAATAAAAGDAMETDAPAPGAAPADAPADDGWQQVPVRHRQRR